MLRKPLDGSEYIQKQLEVLRCTNTIRSTEYGVQGTLDMRKANNSSIPPISDIGAGLPPGSRATA